MICACEEVLALWHCCPPSNNELPLCGLLSSQMGHAALPMPPWLHHKRSIRKDSLYDRHQELFPRGLSTFRTRTRVALLVLVEVRTHQQHVLASGQRNVFLRRRGIDGKARLLVVVDERMRNILCETRPMSASHSCEPERRVPLLLSRVLAHFH